MVKGFQYRSQAVNRFTSITTARPLMAGRGELVRVVVINGGGNSPSLAFANSNSSGQYPPFFELPGASVTSGSIIPICRPYTNGLNLISLPVGAQIEVDVRPG